jgi:hypothetical protein
MIYRNWSLFLISPTSSLSTSPTTRIIVKGFRQIPNPRIDKKNYSILGRNGNDCEVWVWKGKNRIEKSQVKKGYYKK